VQFRTVVVLINIIVLLAVAGVVAALVMALRRNPEPKKPMNLEPFMDDDKLEGRRLERALGWALVFTLVIALALPVYFVLEPTRQSAATSDFLARSVARGARLFANPASEAYDSYYSLQCANCHGVDAGGGAAKFVLQPDLDKCAIEANKQNPAVPECLARTVAWRAPALNTVLLRFDRSEVRQIITYGRPGTPMPAWGVKSGKGVLNAQGVNDLINYLASLTLTPEQAKAGSAKAVSDFRSSAADAVTAAQKGVTDAQAELTKAQAGGNAAAVTVAQAALDEARKVLVSVTAWNAQVQRMNEGEVLFRLNCARCHTKGWSYYDPARVDLPPLPPDGSGAFGPNLTGGTELRQFPGDAGVEGQYNWIAIGVAPNNQYGVRGISSGRMPHFMNMLTKAQIEAIVAYERGL
jgi:mono/diheme cytochrome c family protein